MHKQMRRHLGRRSIGACALLAGMAAIGTAPLAQQSAVPIRELERPSAVSSEPLGLHLGLKELGNGRVLFNDAGTRRLLLLDSTLRIIANLADSASGESFTYGENYRQLVSYVGDTTLLTDYASRGFLVLDASGHVARIAALPKSSDYLKIFAARVLADAAGTLYYRGSYQLRRVAPPIVPGTYVLRAVDSAPVVRASFEARRVDTLSAVRLPVTQTSYRTVRPDGSTQNRTTINPVAWSDDWTITSDGVVAIVRGRDYHVDWVMPDGSHRSSPKLPFDWRRITDDEKRALADSACKAEEKVLSDLRVRDSMRARSRSGVAGPSYLIRPDPVSGTMVTINSDDKLEGAPLDEIPDYWPPIRAGAVQADLDGNVWILPNTVTQGLSAGLIYDVVNPKGQLLERVRLSKDRSIAGFGRNGAIYVVWRDTSRTWHLEKTRVGR